MLLLVFFKPVDSCHGTFIASSEKENLKHTTLDNFSQCNSFQGSDVKRVKRPTKEGPAQSVTFDQQPWHLHGCELSQQGLISQSNAIEETRWGIREHGIRGGSQVGVVSRLSLSYVSTCVWSYPTHLHRIWPHELPLWCLSCKSLSPSSSHMSH